MDKVEVHAGRLEGVIADTAAIQAVDLLTDGEVELLREFASASRKDLPNIVAKANADPVRKGMLSQLSDLGFLEGLKVQSGDVLGCEPTPKAAWAIDRHERRVVAERARSKEDARRRRQNALLGFALGFASGVVAPVASSILKALALAAGLPLA